MPKTLVIAPATLLLSVWFLACQGLAGPDPVGPSNKAFSGQIPVTASIPVFIEAEMLSPPQVEVPLVSEQSIAPAAPCGVPVIVGVRANSPWALTVRADWDGARVTNLELW